MIKSLYKIMIFFITSVLIIPIFYGCSIKKNTKEDKLTVAVTILPQRAFAEAVCGDLADIITIVPPGSSPESYEPTARQLEEFEDADIYFTIGVPLEKAKMLPEAEGTHIVKLEEKAAEAYKDRTFEDNGRDPHIWLSPKRAVVMVNCIAEEMGKIDPDNADYYAENAGSYIDELEQLDTYIKELFSPVAEEKRMFLTFHPAYGYIADDYNLKMYSLEQQGKEATAQDLQNMIDFAKEKSIKVMFAQTESDSRQPISFTEEVGGKVVLLNPLSDDYINNMKYMAEQIAEAMK